MFLRRLGGLARIDEWGGYWSPNICFSDAPPLADPSTPPPVEPPPATPPVTPPPPDPDGGDDDGGTPPSWPDDWRERSAAGDEKALARLKRYASPENVAKALLQTQDRLRSGNFVGTVPEDASPEEIAAFRKQAGIPDKPEGYGLEFPKEMEVTDADKAELGVYAAQMHAAHVPPAYAKAALKAFVDLREQAMQRRHEAVQDLVVASQADLRSEYGRDYSRYVGRDGKGGIANEFLAQHFGEDAPALLGTELPSGLKLGQDPRFVRGIIKMALAYAEDGVIGAGDAAAGGKSIDEEYDELIRKEQSGRITPAEDARINQLGALRLKRAERSRAA